jgi:hypothetical protein
MKKKLSLIQTNSVLALFKWRTGVLAALMLVLSGLTVLAQTTVTFTSSGTWTCPAGVTSATIECWGGGGAGGSAKGTTSFRAMGGAGAGGAYAKSTITVVPTTVYTVTVGGTATTSASAAVNGNPSWFKDTGTVFAEGGAGGQSVTVTTAIIIGNGGTGSSGSSIGTTTHKGGNGATSTTTAGSTPGISPGGGAGAGSSADGNSGTTSTGGVGANGGGSGGNGPSGSGANGSAGSAPGGGGGGAWAAASTTQRNGGNGAASQVLVTYTSPADKMIVTLPGQTFNSGSGNSGTVTAQTAGTSFNITLTATLSDGVTIDTAYSGSKTITYTGPSTANGTPTYTTTVNFTAGQSTTVLATTLFKAETTTITANDGTSTTVASSSLVVNPDAIASYTVTASSPQTVGTPFTVTVTAKDAYANTVTTDSSTVVTMTSASGNVQFDSNGDSTFGDNTKTLTSGTFTISAKGSVGETTTITATDANSKTGVTGSIVFSIVPKYRSKTSGNWGDFTTWQVDTTGGGFVDATTGQTPTSADDTVEIQNTHTVTVTAAVTVDQVTVDGGGQITINSGVVLTLANGNGTDLIINGTVVDSGTFTDSSGTWTLNAGATFVYNTTTGISTPLNNATLDPASTFIYRGSSSLNPGPSISAKTYGNLVFESTSGLWSPTSTSGGNPLTINGNCSIGTTGAGTVSYNTTGFTGAIPVAGNLSIGSGSTLQIGTSAVTLVGNLANSGTLTLSSSGSFTLNGSTTISGSSTTSFANGFTINATKSVALAQSIDIPSGKTGTVNGTLAGTGTVGASGGSVTVSSTGTLTPGVSSIGTLTFATAPSLSGTCAMDVDKTSGTTTSDLIARSGGALTYGGTLTVTKTGADALANADSFTLFTITSGSFSGWFSSVALPTLAAGLTWDTNDLALTGVLDVYSFTTNEVVTMAVPKDTSTQLLIAKLKVKTSGARGTVSLLSVANSQQGYSVSSDGTYITYTPTSGFTGSDSFAAVLSDGHGSITATVVVTVIDPSNPTSSGNGSNLVIVDNHDSTVRLIISGTVGKTYQLQYNLSPSATTGWLPLNAPFVMPGEGLVNVTDAVAAGARFYRTVLP